MAAGSHTVTAVPVPGAEEIAAVPPAWRVMP
jgi:hypothetical protein